MLNLFPLFILVSVALPAEGQARLRFGISFPSDLCPDPLDGRVLLMVSTDDGREPRFQIANGPDTQLIFGVDVEALKPGETATIDADVFGYPLASIGDIPPGSYWVQALLNRYETFVRGDGHTVSLPPDQGEGQLGTMVIPNTVCILKDAPHLDGAKKLVDYLLTKEVEKKLAFGLSRQIPVRPDVEHPPEIKVPGKDFRAMTVDWETAAGELEARQKIIRDVLKLVD